MKIVFVLLTVAMQQVLSQGCVDQYEWCSSYQTVCHDYRYKHSIAYCQKTCLNLCSTPPPSPLPSGNCGKPKIQSSRVIGGVNATAGAWPWQVLLMFDGRSMCGGSLISSRWVVTAAHCIQNKEYYTDKFTVRVGEHNIKVKEGNEEDFGVEKMFKYPSYYHYLLQNDLALLKLDRAVTFGKYVSPICLPKQGEKVAVGTKCSITGWGKIKHPGRMHPILQQATLPVVSNSVCDRHNGRGTGLGVTDTMVCGGYGKTSKLSGCHGDSGGPFVCKNKDSWVLHGAVSWGSRTCDTSRSYTVFARLSEFRNWIDQTIVEN